MARRDGGLQASPSLGSWHAIVVALVFSGLNVFGIINREVTEADIDAHLARKSTSN